MVIGAALESTDITSLLGATGGPWATLDTIVTHSPIVADCHVTLRPSGITLNANTDSASVLRQLFLGVGAQPERVDSLVDALLDWRDSDDAPRAAGAEQTWYRTAHRPVPRNSAFAASEELHLVRGFERLDGIDSLLGVENERVLLGRAPALVLSALPGMSAEVVEMVGQLAGVELSGTAEDQVAEHGRDADLADGVGGRAGGDQEGHGGRLHAGHFLGEKRQAVGKRVLEVSLGQGRFSVGSRGIDGIVRAPTAAGARGFANWPDLGDAAARSGM